MAQIRRRLDDFTWDYPRRAEIFAPPDARFLANPPNVPALDLLDSGS